MAGCEELRNLLELEMIPDLEEAIDELFEVVADAKRADDASKEEYAQLQELRTALTELLHDLEAGEVEPDECVELYAELSSLTDEEEED
ncbi:hypothetical protein [Hydrogenimonas sp.]